MLRNVGEGGGWYNGTEVRMQAVLINLHTHTQYVMNEVGIMQRRLTWYSSEPVESKGD